MTQVGSLTRGDEVVLSLLRVNLFVMIDRSVVGAQMKSTTPAIDNGGNIKEPLERENSQGAEVPNGNRKDGFPLPINLEDELNLIINSSRIRHRRGRKRMNRDSNSDAVDVPAPIPSCLVVESRRFPVYGLNPVYAP